MYLLPTQWDLTFSTISWNSNESDNSFIEDLIKEGNKITHTFYEEGTQKVRCELRYENGDKMSKYIEFALSGPQNNQIVKTGKQIYSPLTTHPEQPKITYLDPTTKKMVTMVVKIDGDIRTMIGDGSIKLSEDGDLKEDNIGKVIIGFEGKEFALPTFSEIIRIWFCQWSRCQYFRAYFWK